MKFKGAIRDVVRTNFSQNLLSFWRESKVQKCEAYAGFSDQPNVWFGQTVQFGPND